VFISSIKKENDSKKKQLSAKHPEVGLLSAWSHMFTNFLPGFRAKVKRTFIMSPEDSAMFPLEIINGEPHLGVPEMFFEDVLNFPMDGVRYMPERPGIYIVFAMGSAELPLRSAIRIYQRASRVKALDGHSTITLVKTNDHGEIKDLTTSGMVEVKLWPTKNMDWENWAHLGG